jgi:hypothetical protein
VTSVVRFEEWQEPTGTTAATVDGSGNVSFSGDLTSSGTVYGDLPSCVLSNSTQACNSGVGTVLTYSVEDHDPLGMHSTSTNTGRITPTTSGYYLFVWGCRYWNQIASARAGLFMKKNGSDVVRHDLSATSEGFGCSCVVYMNGTTDYMIVEFYHTAGSARSVVDAQFSAIRIAG